MSIATAPAAAPRTGAHGEEPARPRRSTRLVWVFAALAVLVRLPFVASPAEPDEAGFLQVARQWTPGGGSLYGHYWVDRPPLLITLFRLADLTGGLVPLRLLGCVAVAVAVLLSARVARLLAGEGGARWTAGVAAALLVSPLMGSLEVNGELLAAPFVALGVLGFVESSRSPRRRAMAFAALGGAAGICAVLVKQNMFDALVFGTVILGASWRSMTVRGAVQRAGAAALGGTIVVAIVAAWTVLHGTSLRGVFDAMYPFRLRAAEVVAANGSQYADGRGVHLLVAWVVSGAGVLTLVLLPAAARRPWRAATIALAVTLAYDAASIALGGGYWLHYLVEMAVPLSILAGVIAGQRRSLAPRVAMLFAAIVSVASLVAAALGTSTPAGDQVGNAIAHAARPGDTLTVLYGDAEVNLAAGLPSPYQYLWSLPIKTLDPRLRNLDSVLSGPQAPTWLVVSRDIGSWGLHPGHTQRLIKADYTPVGEIDGQQVFLHDGLTRPLLGQSASPTSTQQEQS